MKELTKYTYMLLIGIILATNTSCTSYHKISSSENHPIKNISIATTAYHSEEKDHLKYGNKSANGERLVNKWHVASDWSVFPVGTKLKIGGNVYVVNDYGSKLVNHTRKGLPIVDVYQPSKKAMNNWGVRFFNNVEIVEWGSYERSLFILKDRLKYAHCRYMYDQINHKFSNKI